MELFKRNRRTILCFSGLFVLCLVLGVFFADATAVPTGSWGLRFGDEGQAPKGNAAASALARYDAAYVGDGEEPVLYLTFDAGYENGCTGQILDTLRRHQAPAAFFLVGHYLEENPELVRRMADEGHTVGNHTWSHGDMSQITDRAVFTQELTQVEQLYKQITGRDLDRFYRPPQGIYSEENLKLAQELGYKTVFWSLAYVDWNREDQPSTEEAFSKLVPRVHNGAVILLHATSTTNAAILDPLLTKYEELGYRFAPISELFA